jgi:ATP-binding cassette subfamily F protein uup
MLITHDRFMLDRIATEYLALDGEGHTKEFAAFEQWQEWSKKPKSQPEVQPASPAKLREKSDPVKLSYQLQREFDGMEKAIAQAEAEVERTELIASDETVVADHLLHATACAAVAEAHETVRALYARWAKLEAMQN